MFIEIIFFACIVVILVIFFRKLPDIINFKTNKTEKTDVFAKNGLQTKTNFSNFGSLFFDKRQSLEELLEIASKLFEQGKYSSAEKIYLKIATRDPKNLRVYNRLGVIYLEQKNFFDAKEAFLQAIKLDPKKASGHFNYAISAIELKEYRNATDALEHALKLDKNNKKYRQLLAEIKMKTKIKPKD